MSSIPHSHGVIFEAGRLAAEIIETAARDREEALDAREARLVRQETQLRRRERDLEAREKSFKWQPTTVIQRLWRWFFIEGIEEPEEFQCKFCHETFNNPVRAPCDHTFCKACIEQWLNERRSSKEPKRCYCSRELTIEELRRDRDTERAMTTAGLRPVWLEPVTVV
ncbi:hypothetical protein FB45DRAFT_911278 [Roridomyces roridus]|uniref:RING-type domain-containing protein n=1 Tax=Roridomyces roridus TaxID=1738132 RepID=A0AAD7C0J2_9AGAR|nr:hypothetical protein FB45DRAFT_911278 [Roridomyces roridus]